MIHVVKDLEGIALTFQQMLDLDHQRGRIERQALKATAATRKRLLDGLPTVTTSPGYERWVCHLLRLQEEQQMGLPLDSAKLTVFEAEGMVTLSRTRTKWEIEHPSCPACGVRQDTRFGLQCTGCGYKFQRKGR